MTRKFAALALAFSAAILAATPAAAQQAQPSEAEVTALARFAMPRAFAGVQQKCRNELSGNAYMYQSGNALMGRLQTSARGTWPTARRAILAMIGKQNPDMLPLLNQMPPDSLQPFAEEMIAGMVVTKVEPGQCGRIDKVLALLDPLPPENLAGLIGYAFVEAQANGALESPAFGGF